MSSTAPSSAWTWTFTQGFILGQASFLLLALLFVRYVVFSPSEQLDEEGWKTKREAGRRRVLLSTTAVPPLPASHILVKTGYEMATHPAESADWVNVVLAQMLQGYRNDLLSTGGEEGARLRVERWLNPEGGSMSWLDPIQATNISLGSSFPLLSNARIRPADSQGHMRVEIDVDYIDSLSLSLSTSLLINFPRPRFAVLPVALGVELVSIGGTLSIQIHDPVGERQNMHVCLLPDFHLNLKTSSLLGSKAKLQDIPKLEQLIRSRLRAIIQDRIVYPNHLTLALPRLLNAPSSTPIITDIGESAVSAMNEAVRKGLSQFVDDLSGASLPVPPDPAEGMVYGDDKVKSPRSTSQRKIPMPAGFPGTSISTSSTTPLPTPGLDSTPVPPLRYVRPTSIRAPSRNPSSRAVQQSQASSIAPSASVSANGGQSEFRFRGHFASQPPTPSGLEGQERRPGIFNSRAG